MSIQSEINRLKQAVSDAFTAIGNKGGTVPSSKVSGNLATAIQSIPEGLKEQRKTGTFTTDGGGNFLVDCGFVPDKVIIHVAVVDSLENNLTYDFDNKFTTNGILAACRDSEYAFVQCHVITNDGEIGGAIGFAGGLGAYGWDWSYNVISNRKLSYIAIKYI